MNINSIDAMMMNKKMKFKAMENPQEPQKPESLANVPTEGSEANPQEGMSALANNNIAFLGLSNMANKMPGIVQKTILGAGALAVAASTVSCEKAPVYYPVGGDTIIINNYIDLNFMAELIKALQDQNNLTQEQLDELNEKLQELIDLQRQQGADNAEFQEKAYELGLQILEQTIINNMDNDAILEKLDGIYSQIDEINARLAAGEITYAEALEMIKAILNDIKKDLGEIKDNMIDKDQLQGFIDYVKENDAKVAEQITEWMTKWEQSEISEEEFMSNMYNFMIDNSINQKIMIDLLVRNGMSQEMANKLLVNLIQEVKAGNITAAEAYAQIMKELGEIKNTIKDGINTIIDYAKGRDEKLFSMLSDMQTKYDNNEMSEAEYNQKMFETFVAYQEAIIRILKQNGMTQDEANAYLEKIVAQLGDVQNLLEGSIKVIMDYAKARDEKLFSMLSDMQTKYDNNEMSEAEFNQKMLATFVAHQEAIIKILKQMGLNDAEALAYLEKISSQLGDVKDMINGSISLIMDYAKARDEKLFSMLSDMQTKYDNNEMSEAEYNKKMLDTFVAYQEAIINILKQNGGLSEAEARAYLDKIVSQLGDLNAKLDTVINLLKSVSEDVANLSNKFDKYSNEFLEQAKNANADREAMKDKLDLANNYLYLLNQKADKHNENLENIQIQFGNITVEQLKEILGEQSEAWMSFMKGQTALLLEGMEGLEDLNSLTLEQLIQLNKTAMEMRNQLNGLDQLLAKIDWNTAETLGVAQEIRDLVSRAHECKCEAELKIIIEQIQKIIDDNSNEGGILDNL